MNESILRASNAEHRTPNIERLETQDVAQRVAAALADIEAAAGYLKGAFFQAQMERWVAAALLARQSPWLNRRELAVYCRCCVQKIDQAWKDGVFARHMIAGTPVAAREEVDLAIRSGKWEVRWGEEKAKI